MSELPLPAGPGTPQLLLVDDDARLRGSFRLLLTQPGRDIAEAMISMGVATEYCRYSRGFYGNC